jgi:nucleolar protein 15
MSATTVTKKRKSVGDILSSSKKAKTTKAAEKPLKSALKKPKDEVALKKTDEKSSKGKTPKPVQEIVKPTAKKAKDAEEPVVEVEDAAEGGAELTEDQTAALIAGFSSSEDEDEDEAGIAISKLPQAPRMGDIQKRIKEATTDDPEKTPGVIYVGRLPHGFFEKQLRAYFSQFGDILHLRLARNSRTGKSQKYAFIEFESKAVAEIVAKTMDKYLLFGHIMQCRAIPREQVKENIWNKSSRRKPAPRNKMERGHLRRGADREQWERRIEAESQKRTEKAEKLKEMGYEFDMPALKAVSDVSAKAGAIERARTDDVEVEEVKLLEDAQDSNGIAEDVVQTETASATTTAAVPEKKAGKKRASTNGKVKKAKKIKT